MCATWGGLGISTLVVFLLVLIHFRRLDHTLWVHAPRSSGAPCWYCHVWQRGGNLFDFLCLWYGTSPRQMWQRILAGEQF